MNQIRSKLAILIILVALAGFISLAAVDAIQVDQTVTFTDIITQPTTVTANVTTTSTQNSFTTTTTQSTLTLGTQTTTTSSTTTIQTTSTMTSVSTETPNPLTMTFTTTSTQSIQLLGNAFGELLVLAVVGVVVIMSAPKLLESMRRGVVCAKCGYQNPPFTRSYCANCGQALKGPLRRE